MKQSKDRGHIVLKSVSGQPLQARKRRPVFEGKNAMNGANLINEM
jgi:hypothetical protein